MPIAFCLISTFLAREDFFGSIWFIVSMKSMIIINILFCAFTCIRANLRFVLSAETNIAIVSNR